jgi:hypothetical protein
MKLLQNYWKNVHHLANNPKQLFVREATSPSTLCGPEHFNSATNSTFECLFIFGKSKSIPKLPKPIFGDGEYCTVIFGPTPTSHKNPMVAKSIPFSLCDLIKR